MAVWKGIQAMNKTTQNEQFKDFKNFLFLHVISSPLLSERC